jgi:hypothetical protein
MGTVILIIASILYIAIVAIVFLMYTTNNPSSGPSSGSSSGTSVIDTTSILTATGTGGKTDSQKTNKPAKPSKISPWAVGPDAGMLGIVLNKNYQLYLGAGGGIVRILGRNKQELLGPPMPGHTQNDEIDRTIQAVTWSENRAPSSVANLVDFAYRFNPNQCGGYVGSRKPIYSEIKAVDYIENNSAIQVWAMVRDQYTHQLTNVWKTTIPMMTRYTPLPNAANPTSLLIERFILYGRVEQQGRTLGALNDVYLENWCAFRLNAFDRVALGGVTAAGQSVDVRSATALPYYPQIPTQSIASGNVALLGSEAFGIAFHKSSPNVFNCGSYPRSNVIFLGPASNLGSVPEGSIVRQSIAVGIAPNEKDLGPIMAFVQARVTPTSRHAPNSASVPGMSSDDLAKLKRYAQETTPPADAATRKTWQLGKFVV